MDIHAIADGWQHASQWRTGSTRVCSWSVRDVATSTLLGHIRLVDGTYHAGLLDGLPSVHKDFGLAMQALQQALIPPLLLH